MALGKAVKEVIGTLAEEVAQQAPKRKPRVKRVELDKIPDEIKALPEQERVKQADEFLAEDKSQEFLQVRQEDIAQDTRATYAEKGKVETKLDVETDEDKIFRLEEQQRDLYNKANNLSKEKELTSVMESEFQGGRSMFDSLLDTIASTPGAGKTFKNIESRTDALYTRINSGMFDLKEAMRTKWLGTWQDQPIMDDVIRYLKDGQESIRDVARRAEIVKIGDQWKQAADLTRNLRNRAGARIGKLEDWIVPQHHDSNKIRKAGYEAWRASIISKLDRQRIEAEQSGDLEGILESAYKNITQRQVEAAGGKGTSVLAKRHEESRVLHFKTGDDIIDYNKEFGNKDVFATMDAHIRQQSNEIATLQIYGSNPEDTFNKMKELARNNGMGGTAEKHLDNMWRMSTGQADGDDIVSKLDATLAAVGGTHRSLQVASKLGSATISALADIGNIILGAGYRGLSSVKMMERGLDTLLQEAVSVGKVGKNTELANRIGVVSEFASASLANNRYAEVGAGAAQKAAEVVIRASGLGSYTNSLRVSFGLEMAANFAENFTKQLDDTPFARLLKEYGFTSAEWNTIRGTQTKSVKNAQFMDINKVYEVDEALGYKLNEMIANEMDAFVVMPTNRTRVFTTWGKKKGTVRGELARNMMLFKSFPVAVTLMHLKRVGKIDSKMGKVAYGSAVLGVNTIMGGITLWAYDTVTGKTTRDVKGREAEMVVESVMKSGGLGIFGDMVLGQADTRYGHKWETTLVGVPATTGEDILKTVTDTIKVGFGDTTAKEAVGNAYNMAKSYIPGQNLWYTRAVVERTVGEFFGEMIDPDYQKRVRRRAKSMRERGQEYLLDN